MSIFVAIEKLLLILEALMEFAFVAEIMFSEH